MPYGSHSCGHSKGPNSVKLTRRNCFLSDLCALICWKRVRESTYFSGRRQTAPGNTCGQHGNSPREFLLPGIHPRNSSPRYSSPRNSSSGISSLEFILLGIHTENSRWRIFLPGIHPWNPSFWDFIPGITLRKWILAGTHPWN